MRRLKYWIDCRIFKKHRYDYYSNRCIVCGKKKTLTLVAF